MSVGSVCASLACFRGGVLRAVLCVAQAYEALLVCRHTTHRRARARVHSEVWFMRPLSWNADNWSLRVLLAARSRHSWRLLLVSWGSSASALSRAGLGVFCAISGPSASVFFLAPASSQYGHRKHSDLSSCCAHRVSMSGSGGYLQIRNWRRVLVNAALRLKRPAGSYSSSF